VFRLSALGSRGHFMQNQEKRSSMRSCVEHVVSVSLEGGEDGKSGYILELNHGEEGREGGARRAGVPAGPRSPAPARGSQPLLTYTASSTPKS
jgi:hypothetical protein